MYGARKTFSRKEVTKCGIRRNKKCRQADVRTLASGVSPVL